MILEKSDSKDLPEIIKVIMDFPVYMPGLNLPFPLQLRQAQTAGFTSEDPATN